MKYVLHAMVIVLLILWTVGYFVYDAPSTIHFMLLAAMLLAVYNNTVNYK